jgi:hypothetical protein
MFGAWRRDCKTNGCQEEHRVALLSREYEAGLYGHFNRQGYWIEEIAAKERSLKQEKGELL